MHVWRLFVLPRSLRLFYSPNSLLPDNLMTCEGAKQINFWSDRFQDFVSIDPPVVLKPGEQLQTTCVFDTSKRPNTTFGLETVNEMCMDFVGYWPVQRDPVTNDEISICAWGQGDGMTFTFCGDNGDLQQSSFLPGPNPSFNDTVGAPTTFGEFVDTCALSESPSPVESGITPVPVAPIDPDTDPDTS